MCDRHLLRQRRLAGEAAAREAAADARDVQEVERTQLTLRVVDVRPDVTAQQEGNVVALEDRVGGVAREAARRQEHRLARTTVERQVALSREVHAREVRDPPRRRHAETCRRQRLVLRLEPAQHVLQLRLRLAQVDVVDGRRQHFAVQRRHDDRHALAVRRLQVEQVLLGRQAGRDRSPHGRAAAQLVDELVDSRAAERSGCGAAEKGAPVELHQRLGLTSTRLLSSSVRLRLTCVENRYGGITCSLTA
jgi:hypothetical protein